MPLFPRLLTVFWMSMIAMNAVANITEYHLQIARETVNITGKPLQRITVNGSIPGPVLEFTEGDTAIIHVTNKMKVSSSVHWHGLLLPPEMDGVPGFSGYPGIAPGKPLPIDLSSGKTVPTGITPTVAPRNRTAITVP